MSIGILADSYLSSAYVAAVTADSPVAWYRLADATTQDTYPGHDPAHTGGVLTPSGGANRIASGPFASTWAHRFSTTGGSLASVNIGTFSQISLELWVKTTAATGQLFNCRNDGAGCKSLSLGVGPPPVGSGGNGRLWFGADAGGVYVGLASNAAINDGNWHQVVLTWNGTSGVNFASSQCVLYIDGAVAATGGGSVTGGATAPLGGSNPYATSIAGDVSRLAIFKGTALTATQVANHYSGHDSAIVADNPTMFWTCDELLTNNSYLQDASTFARSGSYATGTITKQSTGLLVGSSDKATTFVGGSGGYGVVNGDNSWMAPASFTVEFLCQPATLAAALVPVARHQNSAADWRIAFNTNGSIDFQPFTGSTFSGPSAPVGTIVANTRYHVACTYASGTALIYVNGTQVATASTTRATYNTPNLFVGCEYNGSGTWNGVLDEVAYYSTALSSTRILAHAKAAGYA